MLILLLSFDSLDSEDGGSMYFRNVGNRSHPHGDAIKNTVLRGVTPFNVLEIYHVSQERQTGRLTVGHNVRIDLIGLDSAQHSFAVILKWVQGFIHKSS
jgi:hypothetical protein